MSTNMPRQAVFQTKHVTTTKQRIRSVHHSINAGPVLHLEIVMLLKTTRNGQSANTVCTPRETGWSRLWDALVLIRRYSPDK